MRDSVKKIYIIMMTVWNLSVFCTLTYFIGWKDFDPLWYLWMFVFANYLSKLDKEKIK